MTRTKRFIFALITASLSLVLCLAAAELVARVLAPSWLQERMDALHAANAESGEFGSDRGWPVERRDGAFFSFSPHQHFDISHVEYRNVAHIDDLGGRRTSPLENTSGRRVALFGDSFTFGVGVDDMETFASRLAARFPDHRFINLGVPGTALPQQLAILRLRHGDLHASIAVFFFFLGNDFADILQDSHGARQSGRSDLLVALNDHVCHHPWLEHSYATQLVCSAVPMAISATRPWFELPRDPAFYVMDRTMGDYQRFAAAALAIQLQILVRMQESLNVRSLIVASPDVNQVSEARRALRAGEYRIALSRLDPSRPNRILADETLRAGLAFFDSTACIATSVPDPGTLYYRQDNHFRSRGHEALAACIAPQIAQLVDGDRP